MPLLLCLQKLQGKGDGEWTKSVFASFFGWPEDKGFMGERKKMIFLASLSMSNKLLLVARHILTTGLQKWIHWHHLLLWRKYALEVKAAKGLKQCWVKVKGVKNHAWTAQQLGWAKHCVKMNYVIQDKFFLSVFDTGMEIILHCGLPVFIISDLYMFHSDQLSFCCCC